MSPAISVIVPMKNEAPNVRPLVQRVFAALGGDPRGAELILVDDGSTDETWAAIAECQRSEPRLRAIRHSQSAGQSAALWTGFRACHGSLIATLDGDLQNDPADLPNLLAVVGDCDLATGVRQKRQDSFVRRASSYIARVARRTAFGVDFRDTGCGIRAFKRGLIERLPAFDGFHRFMPILVHGIGARVVEVPVSHHARTAGISKYGIANRLGRGIWDLLAIKWLLKRQFRLVEKVEQTPAPTP